MTSAILAAFAVVLASFAAALGQTPPSAGQPVPAVPPVKPAPAPRDDSAAESLGWQLGVQAWTFRDRSAFETIDVAAAMGLKYIELYPGQPISREEPKVEVGPELTDAQRSALKDKLTSVGMTPVSYGVVTLKNDEATARKHFEFVKSMGMRTLVAEPLPDARDLVSRLADEYEVRVAIHNHPKPSIYWDPAIVLEALKGRSERLGACADTGHWPRSGLRSVDCLKALEGRIIELHFKDISRGLDRPWGTGESDAAGMLAELKRQNFRGPVYVEYEAGRGAALEANVRSCIEFFDASARRLAAPPR